MLDSLKLYLRYAGVSVRGQMQYKASFIMMSLGNIAGSSMDFIALWVLFDRFKMIQGWSLAEAAMLYGMINVSFALAEAAGTSFDMFSDFVRSGDFDRILLRPRSTILQLFGQELKLTRIGRFSQGLIVLLWATSALDVVWSPARITLLIGSIFAGACLFEGLLILQATMCFWTIESIEVMNTMTYGGIETAQYPLSIYTPWLRRLFTFLVPLACVNYLPSLAILGRTDQPLYWLAPLIGVGFFMVATQVWRFGVRRYCSTGS